MNIRQKQARKYHRADGRDRQTIYCVEELTIKGYQQHG